MSDDFNNPFQQLGQKLVKSSPGKAGNKAQAGKQDKAVITRPARSAVAKRQSKSVESLLDAGEEDKLFVEAMRNVTVQDVKRHGKGKELPKATAMLQNGAEEAADFFALFGGQRVDKNDNVAGEKASAIAKCSIGGVERVRSAALNQAGRVEKKAEPIRDKKASIEEAWLEQSGKDEQTVNVEEDLFERAMDGVKPVSARGRDVHKPVKLRDGQADDPRFDPNRVLVDFLSGKMEFALAFTDEYIEGHVLGLDPMVIGKLKAGQYSPEANLDLHGLNSAQAYNSLVWFMRDAYQRGMRTVIVVTGRGRNSPDGVGVLRENVQNWLTRDPFKRVVLAFCTAQPCDGGSGALYVALRKHKKSHGKIHWDRVPTAEELL